MYKSPLLSIGSVLEFFWNHYDNYKSQKDSRIGLTGDLIVPPPYNTPLTNCHSTSSYGAMLE